MAEDWENYKRGVKRLRPESVRPAKAVSPARPSEKPKTPAPAKSAAPARGLDPELLQRLQSGAARCEAELDLHHKTEAEAFTAVMAFLERSAARRLRYLLIVTGRGAILRAALPRWLDTPKAARLVRFFHRAAPRHGGDGAFYVVLGRAKAAARKKSRR